MATGMAASDAVVADEPFSVYAVTEFTSPLTTCCSKTLERASVSAIRRFRVSGSIIANAASVGANTVKDCVSSASVASSPAACSAVTKVPKSPAATAVSTMFMVGVPLSAGGVSTASITCITPLSAATSTKITVAVLTKRLSPSKDKPTESPLTISTREPALDIAALESTSPEITW